jgi:hypothetical protein
MTEGANKKEEVLDTSSIEIRIVVYLEYGLQTSAFNAQKLM